MSEPLQLTLFPIETQFDASDEVRRLPKIDLHRHLLGSVSIESFINISRKYELPLPSDEEQDLYQLLIVEEPVKGLKDLFRPWPHYSRLIKSPNALEDITYDTLKEASFDNIVYTELRASWGMTGKEPFGLSDFLQSIHNATLRAYNDFGIIGRIIFGITRHLMAKHHPAVSKILYKNIAEAAEKFKDICVVGFDLSGIEGAYPPVLFRTFFNEIKELGFRITIHSGETSGPSDIWQALRYLKPDRIAHGLSAIHDNELIIELIKKKIAVEVCPTSNILTSIINRIEDHPIRYFFDRGVKITVNTDNPGIGRTSLSKEIQLLIDKLYFSIIDMKMLIKNSLDHSFAPERVKCEIKSKLEL